METGPRSNQSRLTPEAQAAIDAARSVPTLIPVDQAVQKTTPLSQWQPIETWAPKAEPYWPYLRAIVFDGEVLAADWKPEGNPPETGEWWPANTDSEYGSRIYPTHWMPMPEPPR